MLPQKAYVPLGSLRRAATYPMAADKVKDKDVREALEAVGLGHLLDRLDEEGPGSRRSPAARSSASPSRG